MASVRGIGVAVITRIWGGWSFLVQSRARCSTPKRCCSSMTTKPRFENCTRSSIRACVPMRMSTSPEAMPSREALRSLAFEAPVRMATFTSIPSSILLTVVKCWRARISVGAIMQAWKPLSTASSIDISATRVLPLPTSPCSRRFIWNPVTVSLRISLMTRFCAPVSGKGSFSS